MQHHDSSLPFLCLTIQDAHSDCNVTFLQRKTARRTFAFCAIPVLSGSARDIDVRCVRPEPSKPTPSFNRGPLTASNILSYWHDARRTVPCQAVGVTWCNVAKMYADCLYLAIGPMFRARELRCSRAEGQPTVHQSSVGCSPPRLQPFKVMKYSDSFQSLHVPSFPEARVERQLGRNEAPQAKVSQRPPVDPVTSSAPRAYKA